MADCSNIDAGDDGDVVVAVVDEGDGLMLKDEELYFPAVTDFGGSAPGAMVES